MIESIKIVEQPETDYLKLTEKASEMENFCKDFERDLNSFIGIFALLYKAQGRYCPAKLDAEFIQTLKDLRSDADNLGRSMRFFRDVAVENISDLMTFRKIPADVRRIIIAFLNGEKISVIARREKIAVEEFHRIYSETIKALSAEKKRVQRQET